MRAQLGEVRAGSEGNVVGHAERRTGVKRGATADIQRARTQRIVVAEQQAATIEVHPAAEGVGTIQRKHRGAILGEASGAGYVTTQGDVLAPQQVQRTA